MTPTRVVTLVVFLIGSAGLVTLSVADSMASAVAGSALLMAATIYLMRHFWRESANRLASQVQRPMAALAELRQSGQQLESSLQAELQGITKRVDGFARGVLEYVSQVQLDLEKTRLDLAKGHADLTARTQDIEKAVEQTTSQTMSEVLDLQRVKVDITNAYSDLATGHADLTSRMQDLEKAVERTKSQTVSEVMGVIGVYAALKPERPYPEFGGWAISGDCARRLVELVMALHPSSVVEAGSGLSTLLIAQALELIGGDARVLALEHEKKWMDKTNALLALHGMAHRADVVHAPLEEVELGGERFSWYDLSEANLPAEFEILFIDGPPKATGPLARYPALPLLIDQLASGGVVLMDDAKRPDERAAVRRWQEEIPGLEVVFHPDSKGTVELRKGKT